MSRTAFFEPISPWGKLLLIFGLIILFSIFSGFGGLIIGKFYLDTDLNSLAGLLSNPHGDKVVGFTRFYQLLNQIGIFILPVFVFSFLVSKSSMTYLRLDKKPLMVSVLISIGIVFIILPFINYVTQLNSEISFPDSMAAIENWMVEKEEQARLLSEAFLQTSTIWGLIVNIFIVALVAAIGEELLFRGVILRLMDDIFKNIHLAIIVSSIIFSLFHLQFFGFFPRVVLGMILGYLYVFTRSLWVPIIYHFVNNAASVIIYFLYYNNMIGTNAEDFGSTSSIVYIIGSLLISVWLIIIIRQKDNYELLKN
jgi:hypothetical protein